MLFTIESKERSQRIHSILEEIGICMDKQGYSLWGNFTNYHNIFVERLKELEAKE